MEVKFNFADWPMAVLGEDEFGDVGGDKIIVILFVIIGTVQEHHEVGVLLNGTRFTKVGRALGGDRHGR